MKQAQIHKFTEGYVYLEEKPLLILYNQIKYGKYTNIKYNNR